MTADDLRGLPGPHQRAGDDSRGAEERADAPRGLGRLIAAEAGKRRVIVGENPLLVGKAFTVPHQDQFSHSLIFHGTEMTAA